MSLFQNVDSAKTHVLMAAMKDAMKGAATLQEATQRTMEAFRSGFAESVVLARTYATMPYQSLPERDRAFVEAVAQNQGQRHMLAENMPVLSLLGTSGIESAWCSRDTSQGHLGIPLVSEDFVAGIPMVAGLTRALGTSADWYARLQPQGNVEKFGVFAESFFVSDATSSRDNAGRLLIPAQDFVRTFGVRSVIGVGGHFAHTGTILASIFFLSESLTQTPPWLLRLPLLLGRATLPLVVAGKVYSD